MPRTTGADYWTRGRERLLVDFVREREYIWKPVGNTNYIIQQKYKAYAECAAKLGRGFTARMVRDRWVNIRTTYNHNLKKVKTTQDSAAGVYKPTWHLWPHMHFLKKDDDGLEIMVDDSYYAPDTTVKEEEATLEMDQIVAKIRDRGDPSQAPQKIESSKYKAKKCVRVLDDLIQAMAPLTDHSYPEQNYWLFGKHVTARLNSMREIDAIHAHHKIKVLLAEYPNRMKPEPK